MKHYLYFFLRVIMLRQDRKQTIVQEIELWRKNRLLPEQYCQFLLNLYQDTQQVSASRSWIDRWTANPKQFFLYALTLGSLGFLVLNFNSFGMPLQIGLIALFILISYSIAYKSRDSYSSLFYLFSGIGSAILLVGGVYSLRAAQLDSPLAVQNWLIASAAIWIIIGRWLRTSLWVSMGLLAGAFIYGKWLQSGGLNNNSFLYLQWAWVPLAILVGWIGWVIAHRDRIIGRGLSYSAPIIWIAPEVQSKLLELPWNSLTIGVSMLKILVGIGASLYLLKRLAGIRNSDDPLS